MSPSNDENGTYFLFLTPVTPAQMHPAAGLLARETPTGGGTLLPIPAPQHPSLNCAGWGGGRSGDVLKSRWLQLDGRGHRKRLLFIPGTVAKGFQKYLAEIFYCPACLQPVIMRSRCLMCANALAAFARENPSRERRSGKSGDNYVVQSQTLFCSYCKRPWPPLQEARKTESDS